MTLARTLGVVAMALLLGGAAPSGQGNRVPGPDLAGIADTKAMHAAIIRAIEANTRAQIVIAHLASQDARVAAVTLQVIDAQRASLDATRARIDSETEIRRLARDRTGHAASGQSIDAPGGSPNSGRSSSIGSGASCAQPVGRASRNRSRQSRRNAPSSAARLDELKQSLESR